MPNTIRKFQLGFTFIEMMVSISIMSIIGTIGIAAFYNYNQEQIFQTSVLDMVTVLRLAKSRAQSQLVPPSCTSLLGYKVIGTATNTYGLFVTCSGSPTSTDTAIPGYSGKVLPNGITFTNFNISFPVLTGAVDPSSTTIIVSKPSGGGTKTITVNSAGIMVQ